MHTEEHPSKHCLNCGKPLHGKYCAHCGQEDIDYKVALRHLIPEVLHEYLGFDSQIFKSIPLLLFKPGYLTNEFNEGRREKYIPPLRMYLIVSLLFFFVLSLSNKNNNADTASPKGVSASLSNKLDTSVVQKGSDTNKIIAKSASDTSNGFYFSSDVDSTTGKSSLSFHFSGSGDSLSTQSWFERFLLTESKKTIGHGEELLSVFKEHYAEGIFFFLPVCALLLKLLYIRRKRLYVEHLVFSLHLQSFIFIVLGVLSLLEIFISSVPLIISIFIINWTIVLVYLYMAMYRVYRQRFLKTLIKNILFLASYSAAFAVVNMLYFFVVLLLF
jgi:hypothetical protein